MLRHVSVTDMLRKPPEPVPWVCDGVAARRALTVLAGKPGEGKSWLALAIAQGMTENRPAAGIPCSLGRTIYLDAENGEQEMRRRAAMLGIRYGIEFLFPTSAFDIAENGPALAAYISAVQPSLVILDGFRSLWQGDENDSLAVTRALSTLQLIASDYDVAVLLLHHMSKTGGYRGTGAIAAVPQILIEMDSEGSRKALRWEKNRLGPDPGLHSFYILGDAESVRLVA